MTTSTSDKKRISTEGLRMTHPTRKYIGPVLVVISYLERHSCALWAGVLTPESSVATDVDVPMLAQ
jgi:hypothetical protein